MRFLISTPERNSHWAQYKNTFQVPKLFPLPVNLIHLITPITSRCLWQIYDTPVWYWRRLEEYPSCTSTPPWSIIKEEGHISRQRYQTERSIAHIGFLIWYELAELLCSVHLISYQPSIDQRRTWRVLPKNETLSSKVCTLIYRVAKRLGSFLNYYSPQRMRYVIRQSTDKGEKRKGWKDLLVSQSFIPALPCNRENIFYSPDT